MKKRTLSLLATLALVAFAVTGWAAAGGTSLSVALTLISIVCQGNHTADVTISYTVTSTGAADAAAMSYTIDGGSTVSLPTIAAGNVNDGGGWTFVPPTKTAGGQFTVNLSDGSHVVEVCAVQNGSDGNPNKSACQTISVVVNCSSGDPCATGQVFGEVPANKNLCGNGKNTPVEIQFRGPFGGTATLRIDGPNGFSKSFQVDRAGDSCNYHLNWKTSEGNGGAGTYTFTVNFNQLTFSADLTCNGKP